MPSTSPLADILASAARRLRADFDDSATIVHRGSKGTVRETDVLAFLQKYLPENVRAARRGAWVKGRRRHRAAMPRS